jgi:hypothetical protein
MKKLTFIACIVIVFASCKKESPVPVKEAQGSTIKQQVADLIQKGDPGLYDRLYNHPDDKAPKPSIKITHGIFHYPTGSPESGTCIWNPNCVCHITIVFPALVTDSTDVVDITSNYYDEFDAGQCDLMLNDSATTNIKNIHTIDIDFRDAYTSTIDWTVHEPK